MRASRSSNCSSGGSAASATAGQLSPRFRASNRGAELRTRRPASTNRRLTICWASSLGARRRHGVEPWNHVGALAPQETSACLPREPFLWSAFPPGIGSDGPCRMRFFGVPSAEAPRPQRLGAMLPVSGRKAYGVGADFSRQRPDPSGASRTMYEACHSPRWALKPTAPNAAADTR